MSLLHPQVSVIMPAYNAADHIQRALKSIQNQTLEDIEIIVVDDGSQDRTADIVDRMADRDIRLQVLHTSHFGYAEARNAALQRVHGDYICFCDADDWIEPSMLEDMVEAAQYNQADLVVSGFFKDTYTQGNSRVLSEICSADEEIFQVAVDFRSSAWKLFDQQLFAGVCNKLYVRQRIEDLNISFHSQDADDKPFVLDYIRDIERVVVLPKAYYHFEKPRDYQESLRWKPGLFERRVAEHKAMLELFEYWGLEHDPKSSEMVHRHFFERLVDCIENICNPKCVLSVEEKRRLIEEMITSEYSQVAATVASPQSRMQQMLLGPIKKKNVGLVYSEGRFISFIKRRNSKMFSYVTGV